MTRIHIDPARVEAMIMEMGAIGAHSGTGVWRTVYSPEWVAANDLFARWSEEAGLSVSRDAVGNVWAKLAGTESGKSIVSGSHIDTQTPGGRYDGTLDYSDTDMNASCVATWGASANTPLAYAIICYGALSIS